MKTFGNQALIAEAEGADGAKAAVVFIHGIGGAARIWQTQLSALSAAGYTSVALNLPGYGGRPEVKDLTFEALAADVEAIIASIGLDRVILVGHSLGGMIAQTMLRRQPDAYRAAILCCTSPAFGNASGDFQKKFVADRLGPLADGRTMAALAASIVAEIMGPKPDPIGKLRPSRSCARRRTRPMLPPSTASLTSTNAPTLPISAFPCFALRANMIAMPRRR